MPGVLPPPERIGSQGHQAADAAEDIIRAARAKERTVPAIMLDDENPHEKARSDQQERRSCPDRHAEQDVRRRAGNEKAAERGCDLAQAAGQYRRLEWLCAGKEVRHPDFRTASSDRQPGRANWRSSVERDVTRVVPAPHACRAPDGEGMPVTAMNRQSRSRISVARPGAGLAVWRWDQRRSSPVLPMPRTGAVGLEHAARRRAAAAPEPITASAF